MYFVCLTLEQSACRSFTYNIDGCHLHFVVSPLRQPTCFVTHFGARVDEPEVWIPFTFHGQAVLSDRFTTIRVWGIPFYLNVLATLVNNIHRCGLRWHSCMCVLGEDFQLLLIFFRFLSCTASSIPPKLACNFPSLHIYH